LIVTRMSSRNHLKHVPELVGIVLLQARSP
jgi:hypothetical protein